MVRKTSVIFAGRLFEMEITDDVHDVANSQTKLAPERKPTKRSGTAGTGTKSRGEPASIKRWVSEDELRRTKSGPFYVCPDCRKIYTKKQSMKFHLSTDACSDKHVCHENHQHQILVELFDRREQALEFIKQKELDAYFFKRSSYGKNEYYRVSQPILSDLDANV